MYVICVCYRANEMPNFSEMKKALDNYEEKLQKDKSSLKAQEDELKRKKETIEADIALKEEKSRDRMEAEKRQMMRGLEETRTKVEAERRDWEEEKERVKQTKVFDKVITLNVGGTRYTTTLSTLTKYPDSMLGVMFSGRHDLPQQEDGSYFIDRDGEVFKYILMYLRDSTVAFIHVSRLDEAQQLHLKLEANYVLLPNLEGVLQQALDQRAAFKENELRRTIAEKETREGPTKVRVSLPLEQCREFIRYALDYNMGKITQASRYQYVCTQETVHELQKGALRANKIEFREHIAFHNCDLSGVEFCYCNFMKGASFEGSILHNAVFENVSGLVTNRVHFTPRQVAKARFQQELLDALRANGCIY